ncbi:MAG: MBL fold metallo-hydrolase [Spirochaetia bacterium]|jgi:phosphoribosyl 1,2-cyclic phosphate phosphodiesterase|nr:MBL fold metallo-hydrolase [Spirochaetia bacterium]
MRLTFLGTGTSHGIPVIGCTCDVCKSDNQKNKRTRASVWIESGESSILIDTATEFRIQALREGINNVDCVFLTHSHADHIHGIDDLRPLSRYKHIPVYGNKKTITDVKKRFSYINDSAGSGGGKPKLIFTEINENEVTVPGSNTNHENETIIREVKIKHGENDISGYRIGKLAYLTDCSYIPPESFKILEGIEILIIGALRYKPHPTHFSVNEALEMIDKTGCRKAYLTHMCHNLDHEALEKELPPHVRPAWDGLKINF